jgi:AhpD family alkylhydroperoxidase
VQFLRRVVDLLRVLSRARRNRWDLPRWLARRPLLLGATLMGETALLAQNRVDPKLKALAETKSAALTSCEFCLDVGAALGKAEGLRPEQLTELPRFEDSDVYTELEKLVLRLATCMSQTPAVVPAELRDELVTRLGKAGYVELAFQIAWEQKRGRFYQALGLQPAGFGDGLTCAIPEGVDRAVAARPS